MLLTAFSVCVMNSAIAANGNRYIEGTIFASSIPNDTARTGVYVSLDGYAVKTVCDYNGHYKLVIPDTITAKRLKLTFRLRDGFSQHDAYSCTQTIKSACLPLILNIILQTGHGSVVTSGQEKKSQIPECNCKPQYEKKCLRKR